MSTESHDICVVWTRHHHNDERDEQSVTLAEELRQRIRSLCEEPRYALIEPWVD